MKKLLPVLFILTISFFWGCAEEPATEEKTNTNAEEKVTESVEAEITFDVYEVTEEAKIALSVADPRRPGSFRDAKANIVAGDLIRIFKADKVALENEETKGLKLQVLSFADEAKAGATAQGGDYYITSSESEAVLGQLQKVEKPAEEIMPENFQGESVTLRCVEDDNSKLRLPAGIKFRGDIERPSKNFSVFAGDTIQIYPATIKEVEDIGDGSTTTWVQARIINFKRETSPGFPSLVNNGLYWLYYDATRIEKYYEKVDSVE